MQKQNKILDSRNFMILLCVGALSTGLVRTSKPCLQKLGVLGALSTIFTGIGTVFTLENEPDDYPGMDEVERECRARRKQRD